MTATFAEEAGQTRLTMRMLFESAAIYDTVKGYAVEGNRQTLDRLADLVAEMA
jgi:hypothetical protein